MPKQTSYGDLYTMADDLMTAQNKTQTSSSNTMGSNNQPQKNSTGQEYPSSYIAAVSPIPKPPSFRAPNSPPYQAPQKSVKELLPFEGEEIINSQSQTVSPLGAVPLSKTIEPNVFPLDQDNLSKEIFPEPDLKKPGDFKPLSTPMRAPQETSPAPKQFGVPPLATIPKPPVPPKPPTPPRPPMPVKPSFSANDISPVPVSLRPKKLPKKIILIALLVIGALAAGGSAYFLLSKRELAEEKGKQEEVKRIPPVAFVQPDFLLEIEVPNTEEKSLRTALNDLTKTSYPENTITHVVMRVKDSVVDGKAEYVNTKTFFSNLGISVPENLLDITQPTFMLYLYGPKKEENKACLDNLITEKSCYGPRLGLVLKAQEGKGDMLLEAMNNWKTSLAESGLDILTLNTLTKLPEGEPVYQTLNYLPEGASSNETIDVSYINLPMPSYNNLQLSSTSIDFAVVKDLLVIATSKNAALTVVGKIVDQ